jgi:hypothetical protein
MANVIYIPWSLPDAAEFLNYSQQWVAADNAAKTKHTRNWQIVKHGDPGSPLSGLSAGSTIYVRGHGGPGDHELEATDTGAGTISYEDVCDRMIADGLKKSFLGTIKFATCNSGVPTVGRQAFAAKCSQYFRFKKGYLLISFVGYMGSIDCEYGDEGGTTKHEHKFVTMLGREVKSKWAQFRF